MTLLIYIDMIDDKFQIFFFFTHFSWLTPRPLELGTNLCPNLKISVAEFFFLQIFCDKKWRHQNNLFDLYHLTSAYFVRSIKLEILI